MPPLGKAIFSPHSVQKGTVGTTTNPFSNGLGRCARAFVRIANTHYWGDGATSGLPDGYSNTLPKLKKIIVELALLVVTRLEQIG